MKRKNRKVRSITVDGVEYKWLAVYELKIWKDGKIFYEDCWGSNVEYPTVSYNLESGIVTPRVVAKIIRLINGNEKLVSNSEFFDDLNNKKVTELFNDYGRHVSFVDKDTERKWAKLHDSYNSLKRHLESFGLTQESKLIEKV